MGASQAATEILQYVNGSSICGTSDLTTLCPARSFTADQAGFPSGAADAV